MNIAFIGLGNMGGAIYPHLLEAGHRVTAYDLSSAALGAAEASGAEPCDTIARTVAQAECIFTSLPNPADVASVALDPGGIATSAAAGAMHIDLSTNDPETVARIGQALAQRQIGMLDAPLSGGVYGAQRGQLAVMAGGAEQAYERALPILECFARTVTHVGPLGSGSVAKLVNNLIACNNVATAAEAFRLGTAAGMDPQTLDRVIRSSSGDSTMYRAVARKFLNADWSANFALDLAAKDMALVQALAERLDAPLPLGAQTRELLDMASAQGFGHDDIAALLRTHDST